MIELQLACWVLTVMVTLELVLVVLITQHNKGIALGTLHSYCCMPLGLNKKITLKAVDVGLCFVVVKKIAVCFALETCRLGLPASVESDVKFRR